MELEIQNFRFTKCTNNNCDSIYPVKLTEINKDTQMFCPKCHQEMRESHFVQCESCQTVLNFIPKLPNEEAVIYYVRKCSSCSGNLSDEKQLIPHYFPESYI